MIYFQVISTVVYTAVFWAVDRVVDADEQYSVSFFRNHLFHFYYFPAHISATRSGVGVLLFMFVLVGTLLYVSPFSPLRMPFGGAVLHKVKTLQQWGIYADVISLRF